MTSKTFIFFTILAALCLSSFSAQTDYVSCSCEWLQINANTITNLGSSSFQISSILLNSYYIPSDIGSVCGSIGVTSSLVEVASEERAVSRKGTIASVALAADDDEPSSFLERTQTTVNTADVTNALEFDTYCVQLIAAYPSNDPSVLTNTKAYCKNPLYAYFRGSTFPSSKGKDVTSDRQNYLSEAGTWYGTTLYNYLGCTY